MLDAYGGIWTNRYVLPTVEKVLAGGLCAGKTLLFQHAFVPLWPASALWTLGTCWTLAKSSTWLLSHQHGMNYCMERFSRVYWPATAHTTGSSCSHANTLIHSCLCKHSHSQALILLTYKWLKNMFGMYIHVNRYWEQKQLILQPQCQYSKKPEEAVYFFKAFIIY